MFRSVTRQRFAWLATCALFVACASTPTRTHDTEVAHKKKKKKKKRKKTKKTAAAFGKRDDDEVRITDDEDVDDARRDDDRKRKAKEDDEEQARRDKEKREREEAAERRAEKKRRQKEKEEEEAARRAEEKRKKEEEEEAAREARRKKKEKQEEAEARRKQKEAEDKEEKERLAEQKRKAKEREEDEAEEEERPAKRKREPVAVAAAAEIDMSEQSDEDVIEMDDEPPPGRVAAIPVPGVDDGDDEEDDEAEEDLPPGAMPLAINSRPLTRPKDKLAFHGGLRIGVLTLPDAAGMDQTTTTDSVTLGVSYGLSDKLEVGADYAPSISPGSAKGPLTLHGAYLAVHDRKLDIALAGGLAVDFYSLTDPTTMATSTRTLYSLQLGAWARYRLTPKASLISGLPGVPAATASLSKLSFALPPLPYQLAIGLNGGGTVALDLPIGVGYQAKPKIYALAMLNLAHVRIANTANAFLFKDFIPLALGGFYSLDKIDVGALFSDDLKQGTDYLRFEIVARYRLK